MRLQTDDVYALWMRLNDYCRIEYALGDSEYATRDFAILDNTGDLIQFERRLADFRSSRLLLVSMRFFAFAGNRRPRNGIVGEE